MLDSLRSKPEGQRKMILGLILVLVMSTILVVWYISLTATIQENREKAAVIEALQTEEEQVSPFEVFKVQMQVLMSSFK